MMNFESRRQFKSDANTQISIISIFLHVVCEVFFLSLRRLSLISLCECAFTLCEYWEQKACTIPYIQALSTNNTANDRTELKTKRKASIWTVFLIFCCTSFTVFFRQSFSECVRIRSSHSLLLLFQYCCCLFILI